MKFGIFSYYKDNIIEILSLNGNSNKLTTKDDDESSEGSEESDVDDDIYAFEFIGGSAEYKDKVLRKTNGTSNWDSLYKLKKVLKKDKIEITLHIDSINNDKSGLIFGFFEAKNTDTTLNYIDTQL